MGPLANPGGWGARCCRAGGANGTGEQGREDVLGLFPLTAIWEQGNCRGWESWKAVEEVGKRGTGRGSRS